MDNKIEWKRVDWRKVGNAIYRGFGAAAVPVLTMLSAFPMIPHWSIAAIAGIAGIGSACTSVYELWKTPPYLDSEKIV